MSDYDDDRYRLRNRYPDDDFDFESGYGRNYENERGYMNRNRDFDSGYYGRGSDVNRGSFGQNYGRASQNRAQPERGTNPDWDYNRGGYSPYPDYSRGYPERSNFGQNFRQDYGQPYNPDYGRMAQNRGMSPDWSYGRGDYGRGSSMRGNPSRAGYGYNRGAFQPDFDRDFDFDADMGFEPVDYTYVEWWMIPGPESGRGPQGYQRSDERILEDVCDRLMQHGQIDAADMTVTVENHEVTLSGTVNGRKAKRMAEDLAESVPGVSAVHNQLKMQQKEHTGRMGSASQMDQPRQPAQMQQMGPQSGEMGQGRPGSSPSAGQENRS
jgi:hypothetical protein